MFAFILDKETKRVAVCDQKLNDDYFEAEVEEDWKGNWYLKGFAPEQTEEEKQNQALEVAKEERSRAVSKIIVEVDGMKFDGDEHAQDRMARTVAIATALSYNLETTFRTWVLADNTVAQVTIKQLALACELAGEAQTSLWTIPYGE